MTTIEDIVLGNDLRGVSHLRQHLPTDFCGQAAELVLANPGTVFIATGFYIRAADAPESDGPPGAIAIGRALASLGWRVVHVTDRYTVPIIKPFVTSDTEVIDFPITDDESSRRFASGLLTEHDPSVLIAIERCGLNENGMYLNMRGLDISPQTARTDHLFLQHSRTVGIGDGGNEIGMGNLAEFIPTVATLPPDPAVTRVDRLVLASVSNWGGYGLVAALSRLLGRNLLPSIEEDRGLITRLVDLGAVDGSSGESKYYVDNFTLDENAAVLERLRQLVQGAPGTT